MLDCGLEVKSASTPEPGLPCPALPVLFLSGLAHPYVLLIHWCLWKLGRPGLETGTEFGSYVMTK